MRQKSRRETGSTPVVGSSSSRIFGVWTSAQMRPSFCFIPPDNWPALKRPKLVRPDIASKRAARSSRTARRTSKRSAKNRKFSSTVSSSYRPKRWGMYEELTVEENFRFFADLFEVRRAVREERAARLLAMSGLTSFGRFKAGQLSGGMKQKLGLVCALVHTPKILLNDEPTTGVDPVSRRDFWRILYGLRQEGATIVISTAYLDEAERCNRLTLLHSGHALYCDTPSALKQHMPGALVAI